VPAATIRRIAAEIARPPSRRGDRDRAALDRLARAPHERMVGRPVAMHAMRGISAHSNGFQTCRAIHLLQMLLGAIDCPRRLPLQAALPEADPAGAPPPASGRCAEPLPGPHLGFPRGPEDLLVDADGAPQRIDKAFSWEAPLAAHGMMHMVITNAAGRSLPDRRPVHVHGEHGLELVDEHRRHHRDADRAKNGDGEYRHPRSSTPTPTSRRWWPMPT
jgi:sulfite dehydrogenase (quinone) subunit SoeA